VAEDEALSDLKQGKVPLWNESSSKMIHTYHFGTVYLMIENMDKFFKHIEITPMRHLAQRLLFSPGKQGERSIRPRPS
jgi:hypothetical protein